MLVLTSLVSFLKGQVFSCYPVGGRCSEYSSDCAGLA